MPVQSNDPLSVRNLTNGEMTPGFTDGKKFNFELDENNDYSDQSSENDLSDDSEMEVEEDGVSSVGSITEYRKRRKDKGKGMKKSNAVIFPISEETHELKQRQAPVVMDSSTQTQTTFNTQSTQTDCSGASAAKIEPEQEMPMAESERRASWKE